MSTPVPAAASFPQGWDARAQARGFWLAVLVPLAAYVSTASGHSYWLDAGEFVAAAVDLDIAHPPGHPLAALYAKPFTLLPLGPLAFRVALAQAVAAALASGLLYRAACSAARAFGIERSGLVVPAALCASWTWALSFGVWFQAVRPEVYALQALLLLLSLERLVTVQRDGGVDPRPLYAACLALGLGLANHHVMALFMMPALLLALVTVTRRHGMRVWVRGAAFGLLGLLVYAYLPLRAARRPPMNLGDPVTAERLYWVVSAQVYTKFVGGREAQPFTERALDVAVTVIDGLHPLLFLIAIAGLYAALRVRAARGIGALCAIVAVTVLGVRPWLGAVRGNPDALGYLVAGVAALALLAACGLYALASVVAMLRRGPAIAAALLWLLALGGLTRALAEHGPRADLASFHATDRFDDARVRSLPPRSVVIAGTPQTTFRFFELKAAEGMRRDLAVVPLPFLRYPGVADALVTAHPDLRDLIGSFLDRDELGLHALRRVAARRPLLVELEPHLAPETYASLVPAGLLYGVVDPSAVAVLMPHAVAYRERTYARIAADLGSDEREPETAHQLLWLRYMDALFHGARGERDLALAALQEAQRIAPGDRHLAALRAALNPGHPVDPRRFMQFAAP